MITAFALVVWFADPFALLLFGIVPLLWIGVPATLVGCAMLFIAIRTKRSRRAAVAILSIVFGSTCFIGLAIPANDFVQQLAVDAAKAYPAKVAPLLEAYRDAHGSFPNSLDQLPAAPRLPRLLRRWGRHCYRSDGRTYSFSFPQPGGLINSWDYDSQTRTWHLST